MTIAQFLTKHLKDNGLCPEELDVVLEATKADDADVRKRWNDDIEGYPIQMKATLIFIANKHALRWIQANDPGHWAKCMFMPKTDLDALAKKEAMTFSPRQ